MPGTIPYAASKQLFPYRVTVKLRAAFAMSDTPVDEELNWLGYFNFADPTTLKTNCLTYASQNCFIPYKDKVVPRLGTTYLGVPSSSFYPAIGHMKKYGTMSGLEVEIRVNRTNDPNLQDLFTVWAPTYINGVPQSVYEWQQISLNVNPLTPAPVDPRTGLPHRYYFTQWFDTDLDPSQGLNVSRAIWTNGTTNIFSWTGGIAPIVSINPNVSISTVAGVSWASQGFVDPALDSSLNGTITINGNSYTVTSGWETDTLLISNTAGISVNDVAFSELQQTPTPVSISGSITHGSVTTPPTAGSGISGFQRGEIITGGTSGCVANVTVDSNSGSGPLYVYNVIEGPNGFFEDGETITGQTSTAYTTVDSYTETAATQLAFDVCSSNLNYVYYGCSSSMKLFQANSFNKDPDEEITAVQATQNDLVLGTTDYTGVVQNVYRVTIDSVFPVDNTQTYIPTGNSTGVNDGSFSTHQYIGAPNPLKPNIYTVNIVADATLILTALVAALLPGTTIVGGTSQATGVIVANIENPVSAGVSNLGIQMTSDNMFSPGETITASNGVTGTIDSGANDASYQNWVQCLKNDGTTSTNFKVNAAFIPGGSFFISPVSSAGAWELTDGLLFQMSNFSGHSVGDSFQLSINQPGYNPVSGAYVADTYKWQINGATPVQTGVTILPGKGTLVHGSITGGAGYFFQNEQVVGESSGATGYMNTDITGTMTLFNVSSVIFQDTETIIGAQSQSTTTVTSYTIQGQTQYLNYGSLNTGISISFTLSSGHTLGDYWEITATPGVGGNTPTTNNQRAFANFYYTAPERVPGEGYIYQLAANFWAMTPQESQLYVCTNYGNWAYVTVGGSNSQGGTGVKISSTGVASEPISLTPLKQTSASKPIYPYMLGYLDNDIIYVTTDKMLDLIGRMQLIQLPRIDNLSQPVQNDFNNASFLNGSIEYWNKQLWVNSPNDNLMFCYDDHPENKYWQPPQKIPENGILSIITENGEDVLISHSLTYNQSFSLFTSTSGDYAGLPNTPGVNYTVRARTPYNSYGNRWQKKAANKSFIEGYITGAPPMVLSLIQDVNGCSGIVPHDIAPIPCIPQNNGPFGEGFFGSHPFGSDGVPPMSYFREIWPSQDTLNFFFLAIDVSCTTTNHSYEWLTFDANEVESVSGNPDFVNSEEILPD